MSAAVAAPPKNVTVTITPFPQKVPAIIAAGYHCLMGTNTTLVVSKADADKLEADSKRKIMNARSKKIESRARFGFSRGAETDEPLSKKIENRRLVAEVPPLKVPHEEHIEALLKNADATQQVINLLPEILKTIAGTGAKPTK